MGAWLSIFILPFTMLRWCITTSIEAVRVAIKMQKGAAKWWSKQTPTHGDADFADLKALKKAGHLNGKGWNVGVLPIKSRIPYRKSRYQKVQTAPDACVIGVAPRRMGKSIMANAQIRTQADRSDKPDITVVDPHGDLRIGTEEYLRERGYRIIIFDMTQPKTSDKHNVMSAIRPDNYNRPKDIDQMMRGLQPDDKRAGNDHFPAFARLMTGGLMSYMLRQNRSVKLHEIIRTLVADGPARTKAFSEMTSHGTDLERVGVTAYNDASDRERGSFGTTLARKLAIWLRPNFIELTSEDTWTWEDIYMDPQPTAVFITAGAGADEGAAARLILGNAINTRAYMWDSIRAGWKGKGKPSFPKELRILVDEARLIGNCEAIVTAITALGKADVTVMLWFLSMRDIFEIYPEASVITNSCNVILFGGGMERSTYEDGSWGVGEYTIESRGYSEAAHGTSQSRHEQAQRRIKPDALRRLSNDELVAIMGRISTRTLRPVYSDGKQLHFR